MTKNKSKPLPNIKDIQQSVANRIAIKLEQINNDDYIKSIIANKIEIIVAASLGLKRDTWGWGVDRTNGRVSKVTQSITKRAKEKLENLLDSFNWNLTAKEHRELEKSAHDMFVDTLYREVTNKADDIAREKAQEYIDQIMKDIDISAIVEGKKNE